MTTVIELRKNASQKSIDSAIEKIKDQWQKQDMDSPVLFYEGDYAVLDRLSTFYLSIGGIVRYGYRDGLEAWGYSQDDVDRMIAGMQYA